jgi:hypothetical protein
MTKKFFRAMFKMLPRGAQNIVHKLFFLISKPKLTDARAHYLFTDEHLKFVHLMEAINYVRIAGDNGRVLPQTYFEFGIHSGRTFSSAINSANYLGMSNMEFYAFDSFKGLPNTNEEQDGHFQAGTFSTSRSEFLRIIREKTGENLPTTNVIEGFYSDSLTSKLQTSMPKAGVVHIDVDLYSSSTDVLSFLKPLLVPGSLLIFDDWYCFPSGALQGERKALTEFLEKNKGFTLEPWKSYSTFGQSFFVTKVVD